MVSPGCTLPRPPPSAVARSHGWSAPPLPSLRPAGAAKYAAVRAWPAGAPLRPARTASNTRPGCHRAAGTVRSEALTYGAGSGALWARPREQEDVERRAGRGRQTADADRRRGRDGGHGNTDGPASVRPARGRRVEQRLHVAHHVLIAHAQHSGDVHRHGRFPAPVIGDDEGAPRLIGVGPDERSGL